MVDEYKSFESGKKRTDCKALEKDKKKLEYIRNIYKKKKKKKLKIQWIKKYKIN